MDTDIFHFVFRGSVQKSPTILNLQEKVELEIVYTSSSSRNYDIFIPASSLGTEEVFVCACCTLLYTGVCSVRICHYDSVDGKTQYSSRGAGHEATGLSIGRLVYTCTPPRVARVARALVFYTAVVVVLEVGRAMDLRAGTPPLEVCVVDTYFVRDAGCGALLKAGIVALSCCVWAMRCCLYSISDSETVRVLSVLCFGLGQIDRQRRNYRYYNTRVVYG